MDLLRGEEIAAQYDRKGDRVMHGGGIFLLFGQGLRPDRDALKKFADASPGVSLSFDPAEPRLRVVRGGEDGEVGNSSIGPKPGESSPDWVEFLFSGLTFDLSGVAPAQSLPTPELTHRFDFSDANAAASLEAMLLAPSGHLAGGESSLPVVRGMMALARDLVHYFADAQVVAWPPARSVIGRRFFESTTTAWLDGGAFPALGLTAFDQEEDGALVSVGLAHFIGQELRIEQPIAADPVGATRLAVRLVNHLVLVGGITQREEIMAPDGARLAMEPSENGKIVRVRIE